MATPIVQFVDGPSTTAALRYDFSVSNPTLKCYPLHEGIDLGTPSFTGEPEGVGAFYGYRSLRFTQRIIGTRAAALARMSLLAKEMLRKDNWLRFQWDSSATPVFFKTYHTEPGALSLENAGNADAWDISVPLTADGASYGPRQTVSTATITQAPSGTNPMRLVLPAIKGEVPTPLRVTISPSGGLANNVATNSAWLLGCVAGSASMTDTVIDIGTGDTVTNISGTAAATVDATYFGGSYRVVTIGAATPNLLNRFSIQIPNTIAVGRYKILLRCKYTAAGAKTLLFRLQQWANGGSTVASNGQLTTVTTAATDDGRAFWVDLGEFSFPFALNPPTDAGGTMPTPVAAVQIGTSDGSASSLNVDSIKLIPIDSATVTRTTIMKTLGPLTGAASTTVYGTFDGDFETYWGKSSASSAYIESAPALRGYFPVADPAAAQNLLLVMALDSGIGSAAATSYITALSSTSSVDVSYYPRYLHIGDGT